MTSNVKKAADLVRKNGGAYCKFLSANDSGENGSHQAGILISNRALHLFLSEEEKNASRIASKQIRILWPDGSETESRYTYYHTKKEGRITVFGKSFPFRRPDMTGSLFIISRNEDGTYEAFFLENGKDIDGFLAEFSITATRDELLRLLDLETLTLTESTRLNKAIQKFIDTLDSVGFPSTARMAEAAQDIENEVKNHIEDIVRNPDRKILSWTNVEYELFRAIEETLYGPIAKKGFNTMTELLSFSKEVLNRRSSRAGHSLEHHLAKIFEENGLHYTPQAVTEGRRRPDFIFPSAEAYHNAHYPQKGLVFLAAKTTCKDRWRQILNEADRFRNHTKYLFTLQQGISENQLAEMEEEKVVLVVPREYISSYPLSRRKSILTLREFIDLVRKTQSLIRPE